LLFRTCNHVYDKKNINALLAASSKKAPLNCPVVGCGKIVDPAKLIPDDIMRQDIQQFMKISAKIREARRDDSDDDEPKPAPKKSRSAVAEDDDE
jgi:SUMO ligase MMS21 Smc5/6 complex component